MARNYYKEINDALIRYKRNMPYKTHDVHWICNRIYWGWKWKKIAREQMEELASRIIKVMEDEVN